MKHLKCSAHILLIWLALAPLRPALAQSTAADIVGVVRDSSGAVVPNVVMRALQEEVNLSRETRTGADGVYEFRILPPGTYTVSAEAAGFKKYVNQHVPLTSRQVLRIDVSMTIGNLSENVTVTADTPLLNTDTGTISETRGSKLLSEGPQGTPVMAVFGGNTMRFSLLVRGAGEGAFKAAGSRSGQQEATVDGNAAEWTSTNLAIPYQALREEKITVVGAPAEYRTPVTLDAVTKGGTNEFHGSGTFQLEHARLNALSATSPTSRRGPQLPSHRWNVTAGGPLFLPKVYDGRNRTFLFFSHEQVPTTERSSPFGRVASVPTNGMRQGEFSSFFQATNQTTRRLLDPLNGQPFLGNVIPRSRWNPAAAKALDRFYPVPNVAAANPNVPFNNYDGPSSGSNSWRTLFFRVDQKLSKLNTVGFTFTESPISSAASEVLPAIGDAIIRGHSKQFAGHNTHIVSPTIVNEFRFGYFSFDNERWGNNGGTVGDIAGALGIDLGADAALRNRYRQAPAIGITGYPGIGSVYSDDRRTQRWLQLRNNVSIQARKHTFKAGYDHRFKQDDRLPANSAIGGQQSYTGFFSGDPFADFLLGLPQQTSRFTPSVPLFERRYNELGLYFQDNFQVTSRLTVNLGIRLDRISARTERNGAYVNFDPATGTMIFPSEKSIGLVHPAFPASLKKQTAAQAGFPSKLMKPSLVWVPRISFAYRMNSKGTMVVRGGYNQFSVDAGWSNNNYRFIDSGPFALTETFVNTVTNGVPLVTLDKPFPNRIGRGPATLSASGRKPDIGVPLMQQYTLTLERQVAAGWAARLGYVGSRTTQIWYNRNVNRPAASTIPFTNSRLLNPAFLAINYLDEGGNSAYHGLQAGLTHRFGGGLEFDGLFQWSSEIADVGENGYNTTGFGLENPYCRTCERGKNTVSDSLDYRANFLYELPLGRGKRFAAVSNRILNGLVGNWAVSGIVDLRNGRPETVRFSGRDTSNTNLRGGRADVVPNCNLRPSDGKTGPYLDINCFAIPQNGTFGNASPSVYRNPSSWDVSGSVYKYFPLFREGMKLRINGVFNNLFNHPTWGAVGNNISSPASFGKLLNQGAPGRFAGPRSIVLQAQVQW